MTKKENVMRVGQETREGRTNEKAKKRTEQQGKMEKEKNKEIAVPEVECLKSRNNSNVLIFCS